MKSMAHVPRADASMAQPERHGRSLDHGNFAGINPNTA
jgi:hypothetical protein